jgi:hypothetical protein
MEYLGEYEDGGTNQPEFPAQMKSIGQVDTQNDGQCDHQNPIEKVGEGEQIHAGKLYFTKIAD